MGGGFGRGWRWGGRVEVELGLRGVWGVIRHEIGMMRERLEERLGGGADK